MNEEQLFYQIIKKWWSLPDRGEGKTANQLANLLFRKGDSYHARQVQKIFGGPFNKYFQKINTHKWRVEWHLISREFPSLIRDENDCESSISANNSEFILKVREIRRAIHDEKVAVREEQHKLRIYFEGGDFQESMPWNDYPYLYKFALSTRDSDDPLPLAEGIPVFFNASGGTSRIAASLASIDEIRNCVWLATKKQIVSSVLKGKSWIEPDVERFLVAVEDTIKLLEGSCDEKIPFSCSILPMAAISNGASSPSIPRLSVKETVLIGLDTSQQEAIKRALEFPGGFSIWGPPGTGKTYTLGRLIATLAASDLRILCVATANIAIDRTAIATAKTIEQSNHLRLTELYLGGRIVRYGYPRDPELFTTAYEDLFSYRQEKKEVLTEIKKVTDQLAKTPAENAEARAKLNNELDTLRKYLRVIVAQVIKEAQVVFTTVTQALMDPILQDNTFDLVVIDEASMVSVAHAVAIASKATQGLILAGDWQQLGPIAIGKSESIQKWLLGDAFSGRGLRSQTKNLSSRQDLQMLLYQRRMDPGISYYINEHFYEHRLKDNPPENRPFKHLPPIRGEAFTLVDVSRMPECRLEKTKAGSRQNSGTADLVVITSKALLDCDSKVTIGIITPYRAQVSLIKRRLKEKCDGTLARVAIGTVHAFQGSEYDVIIWDLVDCEGERLGRLLRKPQGERLANVAISRARQKLIVFADKQYFLGGGEADDAGKIRNILAQLREEQQITWRLLAKELGTTNI